MIIKYIDLKEVHGEISANHIVEVVETLVAHNDNLIRLSRPMDERFDDAFIRLISKDFAA